MTNFFFLFLGVFGIQFKGLEVVNLIGFDDFFVGVLLIVCFRGLVVFIEERREILMWCFYNGLLIKIMEVKRGRLLWGYGEEFILNR